MTGALRRSWSLAALALVACSGPAASSPDVDPSPTAATYRHQIVISASLDYRSFAWRAGLFDGAATVRVTSVSAPTWNTPTGARPDEALLLAAMQEGTGTKYLVGRVLTVELVESLRGSWTPPTSSTTLFVPGGELDGDSTSVSVPPLPAEDELGIAFTWDEPKTFASGLVSYIAEIYPVDGSGRVITPLPEEDVTLENIRSHLP